MTYEIALQAVADLMTANNQTIILGVLEEKLAMSSADKTKASLSKEAKLTSELAAILDDRNLTDIEVETETMSVRVSRTVQTQMVAAPVAAPAAQLHLQQQQQLSQQQTQSQLATI